MKSITLLALIQIHLFGVVNSFNLQNPKAKLSFSIATEMNKNLNLQESHIRTKFKYNDKIYRQGTYLSLSQNTAQLDSVSVINLANEEEFLTFQEKNRDKIIILKYFAPWCQSCLRLEPKFIKISRCKKYENLPISFAQISYQDNEEFVMRQGIKAIPSMQIFIGKDAVEHFTCSPKQTDMLKEKIDATIEKNLGPNNQVVLEFLHADTEASM